MRLSGRNLVLNTCENTELSLYSHVILVSVVNNLLCESHVLLVWEVRTVDHYRREAHVDAVLAELEAVTMVKVKNYLWMLAAKFLCILYSTFGHIAEDSSVGIVACALRNLHDNRRLCLNSCLDDGLHLLHCVEVECWDGIATSYCSFEHLTGVHKTQIFVIYHNLLLIFKRNYYI